MELSDAKEVALVAGAARLRRFPRLYGVVRQRLAPVHVEGKDDSAYIHNSFALFSPHAVPGRSLEIGPGSNLGVSLLFARAGAEAHATDILNLTTDELDDLYRQLMAEGEGASLSIDNPAMPGFDRERPLVQYSLSTVEQLPYRDRSFDFVFSNACFEHFRRPRRAIAEIWRILRPGARTVHQIDMRDHRHQPDPLRFLRYGDHTWALMHPVGPGMYQNRWRLSRYVRAFEAQGFRVSVCVNMRATAAQIAASAGNLAPRFRRMNAEDTSALGCLIIADRPCDTSLRKSSVG